LGRCGMGVSSRESHATPVHMALATQRGVHSLQQGAKLGAVGVVAPGAVDRLVQRDLIGTANVSVTQVTQLVAIGPRKCPVIRAMHPMARGALEGLTKGVPAFLGELTGDTRMAEVAQVGLPGDEQRLVVGAVRFMTTGAVVGAKWLVYDGEIHVAGH
jgi:hypothetical protein